MPCLIRQEFQSYKPESQLLKLITGNMGSHGLLPTATWLPNDDAWYNAYCFKICAYEGLVQQNNRELTHLQSLLVHLNSVEKFLKLYSDVYRSIVI